MDCGHFFFQMFVACICLCQKTNGRLGEYDNLLYGSFSLTRLKKSILFYLRHTKENLINMRLL